MPLFKFNLNATVMPSIEVDGTVELTIPHSDAEVAFPLFLVDGTMGAAGEALVPVLSVSGRMEGTSDGEVLLPLLSVDGFVAIPVQIEGYVSFPFLVAEGSMRAELSIGLPRLQVLGEVVVQGQTCGGVTFSLLIADGSATELPYSDCSVLLPPVAVDADAEVHIPAIISCDTLFSTIDVSGSMQAVGNVSVPMCGVDGSVQNFQYLNCGLDFPCLLVDGHASKSISSTIAASVVFPKIQASGVIADQAITGHVSDLVLRYADNRRLI